LTAKAGKRPAAPKRTRKAEWSGSEVNRVAISLRREQGGRRLKVPWQNHSGPRKKPRWGVFLLLGLTGYFLYCSAGQLRLALELKGRLDQVNAQIAATEKRTAELKQEITYLKSDAYVEKVAREQLGLVKPGEIIFLPAPDRAQK